MRKIIYCLVTFLSLLPITVHASSNKLAPTSIEISYINVTLDGKNINSGIVEVKPCQQLQLHVVFNYYGGKITNYSATQLRLDDGLFDGEIQALPNHFEKITDNQAAEEVIVSISANVKVGDVIPVKFIIEGPDISSEEGETITFVVKDSSTDTTDTSSSTDTISSSSETTSSSESSNESSSTSQSNSDSNSSSGTSSTSYSSSSSESTTESTSTNYSYSDSTSSPISSKDSSNESSSASTTDDNNPAHSSESGSGNSKKSISNTNYSTFDTNKKKATLRQANRESDFKSKYNYELLPKTAMEISRFRWLGVGLINFVAAIYLLRKK